MGTRVVRAERDSGAHCLIGLHWSACIGTVYRHAGHRHKGRVGSNCTAFMTPREGPADFELGHCNFLLLLRVGSDVAEIGASCVNPA